MTRDVSLSFRPYIPSSEGGGNHITKWEGEFLDDWDTVMADWLPTHPEPFIADVRIKDQTPFVMWREEADGLACVLPSAHEALTGTRLALDGQQGISARRSRSPLQCWQCVDHADVWMPDLIAFARMPRKEYATVRLAILRAILHEMRSITWPKGQAPQYVDYLDLIERWTEGRADDGDIRRVIRKTADRFGRQGSSTDDAIHSFLRICLAPVEGGPDTRNYLRNYPAHAKDSGGVRQYRGVIRKVFQKKAPLDRFVELYKHTPYTTFLTITD